MAGRKTFEISYPRLYNLSFDHNTSIAEAINKGWNDFTFRRTLMGETLEFWNSLKLRCEKVSMLGGKDKIKWMLTADRKFTVRSLYNFLVKSTCGFP